MINDDWMKLKALNRLVAMEAFLRRLLNPEDLGGAVTAEVRDDVRELLGMPRVEGGAK